MRVIFERAWERGLDGRPTIFLFPVPSLKEGMSLNTYCSRVVSAMPPKLHSQAEPGNEKYEKEHRLQGYPIYDQSATVLLM